MNKQCILSMHGGASVTNGRDGDHRATPRICNYVYKLNKPVHDLQRVVASFIFVKHVQRDRAIQVPSQGVIYIISELDVLSRMPRVIRG